ncbi:MAG: phage holin family protein [Opitutaceae bacterium]|nr:phage holin family protein [Opitutaceae bacterium]
MNSSFLQLLVRWAVLALGVTIATKIVPGIECRDGTTLLVVVLLLSFFNAILRPLLVLFTLPFIIFTMGLGVVVINALLFLMVGQLVTGFYVAGFWSALGGALVVSVTNLILSLLMQRRGPPPPPRGPATRARRDDVIDI